MVNSNIIEEENMKRLVLVILSIVLLVGCSCTLMSTPTKKTEEFLNNYKNLDEDVLSDLELSAEAEGLSTKNTETYKEIMKRQYQDMKYKIEKEDIEGDEATVTVAITVYDLYKVGKESDEYVTDNPEEFAENNVYSQDKVMEYKLERMKDTEKTVDYTLEFYLVKVDGEWVIQEPEATVKEKIHGLYDYED